MCQIFNLGLVLHRSRRKKLQTTIHSNWIINYFSKNFRPLRKLCFIGQFVNFYLKGFQNSFFQNKALLHMSIEKYIARCYWNLGENIVVKVVESRPSGKQILFSKNESR